MFQNDFFLAFVRVLHFYFNFSSLTCVLLHLKRSKGGLCNLEATENSYFSVFIGLTINVKSVYVLVRPTTVQK